MEDAMESIGSGAAVPQRPAVLRPSAGPSPTGAAVDASPSEAVPFRRHPSTIAFDGAEHLSGVLRRLPAAIHVLHRCCSDDPNSSPGLLDLGDEIVVAVPPAELLVEGDGIEDLTPGHEREPREAARLEAGLDVLDTIDPPAVIVGRCGPEVGAASEAGGKVVQEVGAYPYVVLYLMGSNVAVTRASNR